MLRYVTGNEGKLREAREYLDGVETVEGVEYDYPEIQSHDLARIAVYGARDAYEAIDDPVLVDDAGLFIGALSGFPGPYSAFVEDTLGVERVSRIAREEDEHRARFRAVVAYCEGDVTETFAGTVRGRIVEPRGEGGFGYDPIFEHTGRTFAEMTTAEKNAVSHRGRALSMFAEWYADRQ